MFPELGAGGGAPRRGLSEGRGERARVLLSVRARGRGPASQAVRPGSQDLGLEPFLLEVNLSGH